MVHKILIGLGVVIGILPFLGFPRDIEDVLTSTAGFLVAIIVVWHMRKDASPPPQS